MTLDFVSSLGDYAELVRFRNGQGEAVLNLHKDDGLIVADQPNAQSDANDPNYQVVDLSNPLRPNPVADVKQVLEKSPRRSVEPWTSRPGIVLSVGG